MGLIPGIGGLFLMAIVFDYVDVKYWRYWCPVIMVIHLAYYVKVLYF